MFMEKVAGLDLMERDDDTLEENNVFLSQRDGKARDDTCQDVQQLRGSIELVSLVDQAVEAVIDSLSDHLSPWDQLSVKSM